MKIRNKNENKQFAEHLNNAIYEVKQAIDCITYESFPDINKRTVATLGKTIDILENVLKNCIFKP